MEEIRDQGSALLRLVHLAARGRPAARREGQGAADQISLVEFSDFECPACGQAFLDLSRLMASGEVSVRLVHRNFPLSSDCNPQVKQQGHTHACQAAVAYECASAQGKSKEYYRTLFQNQRALDTPSLVGYAARLGLDQGEFERCLNSPAAAARVAADVAAGAAVGRGVDTDVLHQRPTGPRQPQAGAFPVRARDRAGAARRRRKSACRAPLSGARSRSPCRP